MFRMGESGVDRGHHAHSEYETLKHDLKAMYARGEIDRQTYHRLKHMAKDGELGQDDVRRLQREESALVAREGQTNVPLVERSTVTPQTDAQTISLLDWIRQRTEQLREAEEQSTALLREVETKAAELRSGLAEREAAVDGVPGNERPLQSRADRKPAVQQQISVLESRARELREDLQRIGSLRSELALREQETKVAESRRRIAALEEVIREERQGSGGQ